TSSIGNDNIQKVRVTFHYTDADVAEIDETSIRVYWWSTASNAWVQLPGGVDIDANIAWGETDHFSTFGLFGATVKPSPTSSPPPSGGGGVIVMPTPDVTPTVTGEETPLPVETSPATPAVTGTPGVTAGAETPGGEPGATATGDLPMAAIAMVFGTVVIVAAGYLLLRRR
ncbi:MAG TPA: hypothetical protein PLD13_11960, partial [Methanoculleus sp.]|nr:hypothetical protein [Methanoculleus sp.]